MLKNATSIKIKGANFIDETQLNLFFNPNKDSDKVKATVIYGRNGSGKSSIASAYRKIKTPSEDDKQISASLCDVNGINIELDTVEREHVFVFDEKFIDTKVRLQEKSLETIVMLGDAAELTDKINDLQKSIEEIDKEIGIQKDALEKYSDPKNVISPKYYMNKIMNELRKDNGWADRERHIKGNKSNSRVNEDSYQNFIKLKPKQTKDNLVSDFYSKLNSLDDAQKGNAVIVTDVPVIPKSIESYDFDNVKKLLEEEIEKPVLSEREKKLFTLMQEKGRSRLLEISDSFKKMDAKICPFCLQAVSIEYKNTLVKSIEEILNGVVQEHIHLLEENICPEFITDLQPFIKLQSYEKCKKLINNINNQICKCNQAIKMKIDNPYKTIELDNNALPEDINQLRDSLSSLSSELLDYNKTVNSISQLKEELTRINNDIAHYEIKDIVDCYNKQYKEQETHKEELEQLEKEKFSMQTELNRLKACRENKKIAIDMLNACFRYIFFTEKRLELYYDEGEYKLKSNGKSVRPDEVSVGERNIIGLCYYFASILEGKERNNAYKEEYLLVIDDPVSSYDFENRVGILSFLRYQLSMFLLGNVNTRVVILTHDLKTAYDIQKIFTDYKKEWKKRSFDAGFTLKRLCDQKLCPLNIDKENEYSNMIGIIYEYACGNLPKAVSIGNIMRQVLEAFCTFEYKLGISEITSDSQFLQILKDECYIKYFDSLMYKLVLNGDSHKKESITYSIDYDFFMHLSEDEKIRIARDVLCFIFLLNPVHINKHLINGNKDIEMKLKKWCETIHNTLSV